MPTQAKSEKTTTKRKAPARAAKGPAAAKGAAAKAGARKAGGAGPSLVVVESPAKAKTIKKYLGRGFDVKASVGHVKDLPKSKIGVDIEHGFAPAYDVIKGKAKVLSEIKRAAKNADRVFLATDPDREGEAIAWHIAEELGAAGGDERVRRVLFNEITKNAIQKAIEQPLALDQNRFDSQQARRILDRLVGYQISPILWKKVRRGLSAGRVQSVAVRLVVEREREIQAFVPEEYWSLEAELAAALPPEFRAKLVKLSGQKADLKEGETTRALVQELEREKFVVAAVEKKERRRNPPPPFTTAKLQQEAANRLGFTAKKTMTLAQRLYEGVELGDEGAIGLITYMRTDSVRLSTEAVDAVRGHIAQAYGKDHLPDEPNVYRTKQKSAQEAHEAVRPTSLEWTPERTEPFFEQMGERDMFRLYQLIWNRFVACQMVPAVYDQTTADVAAGRAVFRATGSILKFPGYLAVYGAQRPEDEAGAQPEAAGEGDADEKSKNQDRLLPPLEAGMALDLRKLLPEQHFTQPPPRFNESSLIKELEERGIGRPSTYAAILSTIQEKTYVEKVERNFKPTELGLLVTDELVRAFPHEMDVAFTAGMEEKLDEIEEGNAQWQSVLQDFYTGFKEDLAKAEVTMRDVKRQEIATDLVCEKCGKPMVIKWGRMGEFLACSGYPECRNTMNFKRGEDGSIAPVKEEEITTDEKCPTCGAPMVVKRGRFGRFLACSKYPECKTSKPISIGVTCPKGCGGYISERRSKRGKTFYGCSSYPKCDFVSWDRPRNEACPTCGSAYLLEKFSKKTGPFIACPNKECDYRRQVEGATPPAGAETPPVPEEVDA
ncbi:type I DNA topoisomerase [Anaeromyxobacter diazotrophicus]|uniref:DNA topoisomerase 1 n=1 Tax=Anaeromyxobacter diazotrophicus TaxID=2590199 RepID=A0A7I9VIH3_9BACT|nr:type I DNA topoisomerase [Anaeromyxobacter diazotrophicus]GEJ56211.1 DNA topoisomerase 1 [Anaeromyxobacter diazotrophicus]